MCKDAEPGGTLLFAAACAGVPTEMASESASRLVRFDSTDRLVTWEAVGGDCRIICPEALLESIRRECVLAARSPAPLGMGGALLGEASGGTYRIRAWHPIPCRHQRGPSFLLSKDEVAGLKDFLSRLPQEAGSPHDQIVGWFVSHPFSGASLRDDEISLHQRFFRARDLFLLMEVDPGGSLEVTVHRGAAPLEPRWNVIAMPVGRRAGTAPRPGTDAAGTALTSRADTDPGGRDRSAPAWLRWMAVLSLVAIAASAAYLGWQFRRILKPQPPPPLASPLPPLVTLSLRLEKLPGGFLIRWNPDDPALRRALRVALHIHDRGRQQDHVLDAAAIRAGSYLHSTPAEAIEVEMAADLPEGSTARERIRYQP